jgi:threonine-phosphate decarboxylase
VSELLKKNKRFVDFTIAVNPLGPSRKVKQSLRKGIKKIGIFPDNDIQYLKRNICTRESIPEDSILFGYGSTFLLRLLIHIRKPANILLLTPLSRKRAEIFENTGSTLYSFPLVKEKNFIIGSQEFIMATASADFIYLANPHDITGTIIPLEEIERLIDESEKQNKTLVIDEAYGEFAGVESPVAHVVCTHNVFIVRTFSTFHGLAGLRAGYIIGPQTQINTMRTCMIPPQLHTLAFKGAAISLKDKGHHKRTIQFIENEKDYMMSKLSHLRGITISNTKCNFLLICFENRNITVKEKLLHYGILIDDYQDGNENYLIRLPVKTHKENAYIVKRLKAILENS